MKQSKLVLIVYIVLLNITIISLILFNSENDNKLVEKNKEIVLKENVFAVMVENENKTGYVESNSDTWPSNMGLNEELTYCKDEKGEIIENPLTVDNGAVTVRTNKKIYCMLYFYDLIPEFTYTGDYEIVDDNDNPITTSAKNWKIRFLTSGTLTFKELDGAKDGIDVFLVGGGAGGEVSGGGGGYTGTEKNVSLLEDTGYEIVVGEGGGKHTRGEESSAFGITVEGGNISTGSYNVNGGAGGSGGGGAGGDKYAGGNGGYNGSDGVGMSSGYSSGGEGQGTTTKEFGEENGKLYAGGGAGSGAGGYAYGGEGGGGDGHYLNVIQATPGDENTGGGGGGNYYHAGFAGGSGIVIIRNARN